MKKLIYLFIGLLILSCTPEDGVDGINGVDGQDGADGQDGISILMTSEPDTFDSCGPGISGEIYRFYRDLNGDGVPTEDELITETIVCNGQDGADGADGQDGVDASGLDGLETQFLVRLSNSKLVPEFDNTQPSFDIGVFVTNDDNLVITLYDNGVDSNNPSVVGLAIALDFQLTVSPGNVAYQSNSFVTGQGDVNGDVITFGNSALNTTVTYLLTEK